MCVSVPVATSVPRMVLALTPLPMTVLMLVHFRLFYVFSVRLEDRRQRPVRLLEG